MALFDLYLLLLILFICISYFLVTFKCLFVFIHMEINRKIDQLFEFFSHTQVEILWYQ